MRFSTASSPHLFVGGSVSQIMPAYADQIPPEDRWAIVAYVRALQRAWKGTLEDVDNEEARERILREQEEPL